MWPKIFILTVNIELSFFFGSSLLHESLLIVVGSARDFLDVVTDGTDGIDFATILKFILIFELRMK